ncbi:MAG: hypothetical protein ABIQ31_03840 [Ferruginibacter sp.]
MLNDALANFYKRDIGKLIEEVNLFINEKNLWKTYRSVKNSSGDFVLPIIGGLNYLIGATLRIPATSVTATRNLSEKTFKEKNWQISWKHLLK